jgi:hypothetical protein
MQAESRRAVTTMRVDGGAAANNLLLQMQSDFGESITVSKAVVVSWNGNILSRHCRSVDGAEELTVPNENEAGIPCKGTILILHAKSMELARLRKLNSAGEFPHS